MLHASHISAGKALFPRPRQGFEMRLRGEDGRTKEQSLTSTWQRLHRRQGGTSLLIQPIDYWEVVADSNRNGSKVVFPKNWVGGFTFEVQQFGEHLGWSLPAEALPRGVIVESGELLQLLGRDGGEVGLTRQPST